MSKGKFAMAKEKEQDLVDACRSIYREAHGRIHFNELGQRLAEHPASRFWVSAETAYVVIKRMLAGAHIETMRDSKRRMYEEIYRRVVKMRNQEPQKSLQDIVECVVEQPAPSFYMTPGTAYVVLSRTMRKRRRKCVEENE